jgi:hypothetical protein
MKILIAGLLASSLLTGCNAGSPTRDADATYTFVETNNTGKRVRTLVVTLTKEEGDACLGGRTWKKARVISDTEKSTRDPVFAQENGHFEILLNNGPCDAYDSYVGTLEGHEFTGYHVVYGLGFSKPLGNVSGKPFGG